MIMNKAASVDSFTDDKKKSHVTLVKEVACFAHCCCRNGVIMYTGGEND